MNALAARRRHPAAIALLLMVALLVTGGLYRVSRNPMYIAMAKGYFAEADIEVKIVTIETGGGHTNAVLSGQNSTRF